METMMDELARAAGQDPLAFRLALLQKNARAAATLRLAAEKGGWGATMRPGVAQGLALHESFESAVAQVVEVSLKDGKVRVERVVCAVDCGVAVNPDIVRAQMEGCIGFALGALYYSEIDVRDGAAVQRNFDTYKALRIHEIRGVVARRREGELPTHHPPAAWHRFSSPSGLRRGVEHRHAGPAHRRVPPTMAGSGNAGEFRLALELHL